MRASSLMSLLVVLTVACSESASSNSVRVDAASDTLSPLEASSIAVIKRKGATGTDWRVEL